MESSPENGEIFLKERKFFDASALLAEASGAAQKEFLRHARIREGLKVAAIAVLVWMGSYGYYRLYAVKKTVGMQTVSVPAGQRVNLLLPDGTEIWLNARTTLKYPVSFNDKERAMELDGEAYFNVVEDDERPFIVYTDKGSVAALGTDFNVEAYASSNEFITTLMEGNVKVTPKDNPAGALVLAPGRKAVWTGDSLRVETVDDYAVYRWTEGLICFKDESIPAILKKFEKYYGVTIHVKNPSILHYCYTGKFRHTDGVDYALRVLQKDVRFKYTRDDELRVIYIE